MKFHPIFTPLGREAASPSRKRRPLGTMMLALTTGVFLIIFIILSMQDVILYFVFRFVHNIHVPAPKFWRPIPLLMLLSAMMGTILTILVYRIPLRPIQNLINAVNQLAQGNFHVRIQLGGTRELEQLSDSFNRMAQELENTELLRSDFINNFSHEFKTPIVSLRGFAKLLKNDNLSKQERDEYLDIIINESNRLAQLATNVLNLSKIEKINILSDLETFDLSEEIRQSILLLESKWQKKEIEWIIDMDELKYYGNRNLLNQVWINLLDNAIKFSPEKGKIKIKLHTGGSWGLSRPGSLIFQVLDNGCGMDDEVKAHIFDRFYQGDSSHTLEGNGIGLTVVQKIVELHGGTIEVQSEKDIGTTFTVTLPVAGGES